MKHEEQQKMWDEEHRNPTVLKQMDSVEASSGVEKFWKYLVSKELPSGRGLEMGCGKGRNVIWLAKQGVDAHGFDFSPAAIDEAQRRGEGTKAAFQVADATRRWPYESDSFDFGVDCFASTDIESPEGRTFALSEMHRVLKPGGLLLAYLLSVDDEYHKEMLEKSPAGERNAFLQPTGKFEKVYDESDIAETFAAFEVVEKERMLKKTAFFGKEYQCDHFWLVLRKPI